MGHRREEDCPKVFNGSITLRKARARTCQHARNDWTCSTIWVYINWPLGPYQLNDDVRKRVTLKVWGSVFCYMASRAIHVELATTLSTENVLIAYQRLTGTWNWVNIENPSSWFSTQEWCCRSCCVNSKEGIPDSWEGGLTTVSYIQLFTSQPTLQMSAQLMPEFRAERTASGISHPTLSYLVGHPKVGTGKLPTFSKYPYKRLRTMQSEVSLFWRSWNQLAGPNLFVRSKWHTGQRNVAIGDVVWLCDQNALRRQFK